jgi:SNF2 family DNA or RNA helicase
MPDRKPLTEAQQKTYAKLKEVRASTTVSLKPTPLLRKSIPGLDGEEHAFSLRYYQVQGVFHMVALPRMILGDDTGLGKTIESIAALCYLWAKEPNNRVIVVAPKSAIRQWAAEIQRFTTGLKVFLASEGVMKGEAPVDSRRRVYEAWASTPTSEHPILILNYALLVRDWHHGGFQPPKRSGKLPKQPVKPGLLDGITGKEQSLVIVFDEATAFKTQRTKTWEIAQFLSARARRVYGLTATLLKNNLMEGYSIYKAIKPDLFGTKTKFLEDYCHVKIQAIGRKRINLVVGYKNLGEFREVIDPFFLGRKKHTVAKELPALTTKEISFELSGAEDTKYTEALSGVLELGDGEVREFEDTKALTSLIYCQQVVNSLALLRFKEGVDISSFSVDLETLERKTHTTASIGSKERELVDLLTGELDGEKVIVFTRFESIVARLQEILRREGIVSTRITGKENDKARAEAQTAFQDLQSSTKVIFITAAGSEAINLQSAMATIFFDSPWSWGDYLQTLGRMIRIGSPNQRVLAFHLLAERPGGRKTIDHHVVTLLRRKKHLIDQVLGEAAIGALKFEKNTTSLRELVKLMKSDEAGVKPST